MRRTGWGGSLPESDDAAVQRILWAGRKAIADAGAGVTLSHVAEILQVSRRTVYRYFPSTQALLEAVSFDAGREVTDALIARLTAIEDPCAAIVELVASAIEAITTNEILIFLLGEGRAAGLFDGTLTDDHAQAFARSVVRSLSIDWHAIGFDDRTLDGFTDWCTIIVSGYVYGPKSQIPAPETLRAFLTTWLSPAINAIAGQAKVI